MIIIYTSIVIGSLCGDHIVGLFYVILLFFHCLLHNVMLCTIFCSNVIED
jgi:hypothetical protein